MNDILAKQLSLDFCCTEDEVRDQSSHFSFFRPLEGRRRFRNDETAVLKIAAINGKLLFTGKENLIALCGERYRGCGAEWFFEYKELYKLDLMLRSFGCRIGSAHPFYISESFSAVKETDFDLCIYRDGEIERFRGDERFDEAFAFCPSVPDRIGIAALVNGSPVAMAGASADSPLMWQIGINVDEKYRGKGVGAHLVTLLKNEILRMGILPFYGTSPSHFASQRVALKAGFLPTWAELYAIKISESE